MFGPDQNFFDAIPVTRYASEEDAAGRQQFPKAQHEFDEPRDDYGPHITRSDTRLRLLAAYDAPSILQIH